MWVQEPAWYQHMRILKTWGLLGCAAEGPQLAGGLVSSGAGLSGERAVPHQDPPPGASRSHFREKPLSGGSRRLRVSEDPADIPRVLRLPLFFQSRPRPHAHGFYKGPSRPTPLW